MLVFEYVCQKYACACTIKTATTPGRSPSQARQEAGQGREDGRRLL
jgi:hypothetical protein